MQAPNHVGTNSQATGSILPTGLDTPPIGEGRLKPTDLAIGESAPVAIGLLIAVPFLATPWLLRIVLHYYVKCDTATACIDTQYGGLWLLRRVLGIDRLPQLLITQPVLSDALIGIAGMVVVILLLALLQVPILGGFAPVLKISQQIRPRSGSGFDFVIREKGRPHRIGVQLDGMFAGYPGDGFISIKLQLPTGETQTCEQTVRPVAQSGGRNGVADYLFDPIFFQFTPELAGKSHLWLGYGTGPECKVRLTVQRRS